MEWYVYLAYFVGGIFLANSVPHLTHGISGKRFQSPFASPPGVGESSPLVNVAWGLANLIIGYVLIFGVGDFRLGISLSAVMVGLGAIVTALGLALYFGRVRSR